MNRDALYGSALQYLAEEQLIKAFGGTLPEGMAFRRPEVRGSATLIPDMQLEMELKSEMRFPGRNASERVVFDWTSKGQAGKIRKYTGGQPPVTWGVEIVQPGPPAAIARPSSIPAIIPRKIGPPDINNPPPPLPTEVDDPPNSSLHKRDE